jgi:Fe-S cluster biosynthesis and repair protein YggX
MSQCWQTWLKWITSKTKLHHQQKNNLMNRTEKKVYYEYTNPKKYYHFMFNELRLPI